MTEPDEAHFTPTSTPSGSGGSQPGQAAPEHAEFSTSSGSPRSSSETAVATTPPQRVVAELTWASAWRLVGTVLVTLLLLRFASEASTLLVMVALSFFFSLALDPAVRWLHHRYDWRRGAAVGVIYAAGVIFFVFLLVVLIPAVGQVAGEVSENLDDWVKQLGDWAQSTLGVTVPDVESVASSSGEGGSVSDFLGSSMGTVLGFASTGVAMVFNMAAVAMFTFYFTAEAPVVQETVLRFFSPHAQQRIGWTWDQAIVQTGGYFYSRMLLMAINGTGFFLTMAFLGVPIGLALGLAVFSGFVSVFIPAIGTYIGGAVPTLVTLVLSGYAAALIVLAYVLIYQQIENYWLSPRISANTMSLNGGVAFGAALAGGAIGGPIGAFVALPVTALIASSISNYVRSYEVVYDSRLDDEDEELDQPDGPSSGKADDDDEG